MTIQERKIGLKQSKQKVFFFPHDRINGSQVAKMKKSIPVMPLP